MSRDEEALLRLAASADQDAAQAREVARVLGVYMKSLLAAGFGKADAMELVHAYAGTHWDTAYHRCCPCNDRPF